ncbi:MAG: DUF6089 family protein [Bacteroidota bacterium]
MNKIKRNIILLLTFACLLIPCSLSAQVEMYIPKPMQIKPTNQELGFFLGSSYYIGDLNPIWHFNRFTYPAAGGIYRFNFNTRFAIKAFTALGLIEGDDAYSQSDAHRNRNLSFKSKVFECSIQGEFNFLPFLTGSKKFTIVTPYVFMGFGIFHFNPMGLYQGRWYALQTISTEGQGTTFSSLKRYSLTQFCIPFGVGIKFNAARRVGISLEWGLRKTFTDYLDDVSGRYVDPVLLSSERGPVAAVLSDRSFVKEGGDNIGRQRGNSFTHDWYSFAGLIIIFKMKGNEGECAVPY